MYETGKAKIESKSKEEEKENRKEKVTVENNLQAPIAVIVKKIQESDYKGYAIEIYDRTKYKKMDNAYLVTAIDKLVIIDGDN